MSGVFESDLLEPARIVLEQAGFNTEAMDVPLEEIDGNPLTLLLAQNAYFIVAVAAGATVDELVGHQEAAVLELTRRAEHSSLGAKQWDLYLVLLASQSPAEGKASSELVSLRHNTRLVRRLAQAGVQPTIDDLRRVLRTFLPLPEVSEANVLVDALVLLEQQLVAHGVSEELAGRAIAAFRETGSLSSV